MAAVTEFGLLGPVAVRCGDVNVAIPVGKQRVLLAALLLKANCMVPSDELADAMWGAAVPPSADASLRNHVRRLRHVLGDKDHRRIATAAGGYMITATAQELDITRFDHLASSGHLAARAGQWHTASAQLSEALALWRGQPLLDVPSDTLARRELPRLLEQRLLAIVARIEADIRLGRHAEVITELRQLVAVEPMRERPHELLMLALYRSGQPAEALATYQAARCALRTELGIEPGPRLRELQQGILTGDPSLASDGSPLETTAAGPGSFEIAEVPRQLPGAVTCFTGRDAELAALTGLLGPSVGSHAPALVISAIGGTAGVGKTALAIEWAHRVAERFPDGQLYINLRGYDAGEPISPADALASVLRTLAVAGPDIPDAAEERASLYRSKMAGRRVLVLLDNARDANQVRPLLPGEPGCAVVVTSRDSLAGLVAANGAVRLDLDVLPLADAVALLRSLVGGRVDDDQEAAVQLAMLCARLPLALRIAAELAVARQKTSLPGLTAELAADQLDCLDSGDDHADLRTVFSWSLRQLSEDVGRAFTLIGLHPGADLDVHAAAALTGTTIARARHALSRLHRASLVQPTGPGRYGMHDLLRAYASDLAAARDTDTWQQQGLTRLFDFYLATASAAMNVVAPAEAHWRPPVVQSVAALPAMRSREGARAWLDAEQDNLAAVITHCASHGWHRHAMDLASTLYRHFTMTGHLPEALTIYREIRQLARRLGDVSGEADALKNLGGIAMLRGHFAEAADDLQAALKLYRRCGNKSGAGRALHNLGMTQHNLHDLVSASRYYHLAMTAFLEHGDSHGVRRVLVELTSVAIELQSLDKATDYAQRALQLSRDGGDLPFEAEALERLGDISLCQDQLIQAAEYYEQALAIDRRVCLQNGVAAQLRSLAKVKLRLGDHDGAISNLLEASAVYRETGYKFGEIKTLVILAKAYHGTCQFAAARSELEQAIRLANETGNTYLQASARCDIAAVHRDEGQEGLARLQWQHALDLYCQIGAANEADQIRTQLTAASPG